MNEQEKYFWPVFGIVRLDLFFNYNYIDIHHLPQVFMNLNFIVVWCISTKISRDLPSSLFVPPYPDIWRYSNYINSVSPSMIPLLVCLSVCLSVTWCGFCMKLKHFTIFGDSKIYKNTDELLTIFKINRLKIKVGSSGLWSISQ